MSQCWGEGSMTFQWSIIPGLEGSIWRKGLGLRIKSFFLTQLGSHSGNVYCVFKGAEVLKMWWEEEQPSRLPGTTGVSCNVGFSVLKLGQSGESQDELPAL